MWVVGLHPLSSYESSLIFLLVTHFFKNLKKNLKIMVRYEFDRCIYYVSLFRMRMEAEKKQEELVQLILKQCIIYM